MKSVYKVGIMNHKDLFKSKLTIRESQADRRQNFKNKRALERDNIRNFGRDITMTLENSPSTLREHEEVHHFKNEFKKKYREIILNKKDKEAALSHWRPPFVSVVPVGKYIEPPTTSALAKRITKTQENIQKTLTAKKVFPIKTPDEARRSKRNIKPLKLNSESKNNQFDNYVRKIGRENAGFTFVHSTTAKNKKKINKSKRKSIVINNFQVSDEDDLAGISPIEDASEEVQNSIISTLPIPQEIVSSIEEMKSVSNNYISPFVTTSRGKSRRETIKNTSLDNLNTSNDLEEDDTEEMKNNREAAMKYENYLNDEISRLQELNQKWELYRSENMHLTDCVEMIDGTVGQTKLLMSSKFLQFQKVIDNCRFQNGDRPIFPLDLEGFWDVVKLQIKNVDDRFEKLENLKANDWNDEIITTKIINKKRAVKKGKTKSKSVISSLKGLIENKRRQHQLIEGNTEIQPSSSGRKTRQSFRAIVLSATAIKHAPQLNSLTSSDIIDGDKIEINHELENLNLNSPVNKFPKKRGKSIRFVEPRQSYDSDVICLENSPKEDKENELIEQVTPVNSKRTSKKYRDTPKIPILNLTDTPQTKERRRSVRTPKSKLSFCDELHNCSIRDSPIRANKRTPKRTRRITTLINE